MAYSFVTYTSAGGQTYNVPFPYLEQAHVKVYINGVATSAFTWSDAATIHLTNAPAVGATVFIKRETPRDGMDKSFSAQPRLKGGDLDEALLQAYYIGLEALDGTQIDWDAVEAKDLALEAQAAAEAAADLAATYTGSAGAGTYMEVPAAPATLANEVKLYAKETGGTSELFIRKESNGAEVQVTSGAGLSVAPVADATEGAAGKAELATQAETDAGTDDARIVTPKKLYETYGLFRKNILINGGFSVAQRGTLSITTSFAYGACDRWLMFFNSSGGTGSGSYVTGYSNLQSGIAIAGTSLASTNANSYIIGQRIEAKDSAAVRAALAAGKKLSFQCKIYHDIGSARDASVQIFTANAADNFSAVTSRYTSGNTSCSSGSWTTVKYEGFSPTNTDFDKGFVLYIHMSTPASMSGKNVYIGDAQLEIGERCTEVEVRPYATELALCQRYYLLAVCGFRHYNNVSGNVYFGHTVNYPTTMRSTPTITVTAGTRTGLVSSVYVVNQGRSGHVLCYYVSGSGDCYAYDSFTANADL